MRIGIWLSSLGGSPLQVGLERGFRELGHSVEIYRPAHEVYDLVVMFCQTAHDPRYVYPPMPSQRQPVAFVDSSEVGYFKRLPEIAPKYANAFTVDAMAHDTKNAGEQRKLYEGLQCRSFPYFLREFHTVVNYPASYHPIDYPLYHLSNCPVAPNREEYLRRSLDLFVSWGASHPWRLDITKALRDCHTRCEVLVLEENGTPRMPQAQFFERTRSAKCSVSFDGYGSGSFRMTEVLVRCLLLQGPLSIRMREPLVDGLTCINYDVVNDAERFVSTNVCEKLREALADPEWSYLIYASGYEHCRTKLSERATAEYVLETARTHNWKTPTQLDL